MTSRRQRRELLTAADLLASIHKAAPSLACQYGTHEWAFNQPYRGMKTCAGYCGGVYAMTVREQLDARNPAADITSVV